MDALPFLQEMTAAGAHLLDQSPKIRALDADGPNDLRFAVWPQKIDLCLTRPGDVNMRWFMIGGVDDEPKAMSAVDDDHHRK
jgi:hypothetical protein